MNPVAEGALIASMVVGGLVALLVLIFWDERTHEPRGRLIRKSPRAHRAAVSITRARNHP